MTNFCIKPVIVSYYSNLPYVQHHDSKSDRHTIACSGFFSQRTTCVNQMNNGQTEGEYIHG